MRKFSFRPAITLKGRKFKGLRGWAGKPFHPPLTDVPVTAYIFVAAFDVISRLGHSHPWAHEFYKAGTFTIVGGVLVSLFTALTGFWDWLRSTEKGTQARRTVNTHAWIMITTTVVVIVDTVLRMFKYQDQFSTPGRLVVLSVVAAALVSWGSTYGGELVYDYGFNIETAGDHPVWHVSEVDVFPGQGS
jgi:uncharacterized membrane protein